MACLPLLLQARNCISAHDINHHKHRHTLALALTHSLLPSPTQRAAASMDGLSSSEGSRASSPLKGSRPPGSSFAAVGDGLRKAMGMGGNAVHPAPGGGGSGSTVGGTGRLEAAQAARQCASRKWWGRPKG